MDNTTQLDKEDRQSKIGTVAVEEEDAEGEDLEAGDEAEACRAGQAEPDVEQTVAQTVDAEQYPDQDKVKAERCGEQVQRDP